MRLQQPRYLYEKMGTSHNYNTRAEVGFNENFSSKSMLAANSFCYKGAVLYNGIPRTIVETTNMMTFKRKLKSWIKENVCID